MASSILEYISCSSKEYDEVANLIRKTCPDECIVSIDKVKNPRLEEEFQKIKAEIQTKRGQVSEKIVFHGTSEAGMWSIVSEGFKISLNKRSLYGVGTYCSESASVARTYAQKTQYDDNAMLICKMVWGTPVLGKANKPINTQNADVGVDKLQNPAILVVPYTYAIIPLYAVQFYIPAKH